MIQALERAAGILRLTAENGSGMRLCDLARACGLKRNTVYNIAETLVKEGLLLKKSDGKYVTGGLLFELAARRSGIGFRGRAETFLTELHRVHPEAVIYYSELLGTSLVPQFNLVPRNPGKIVYLQREVLPLYTSVAGLVFLAFLPPERVRELMAAVPFDFKGLDAWGSNSRLDAQLEKARLLGYTETPGISAAGDYKIGLPLWNSKGVLGGALTFHIFSQEKRVDEQEILKDILEIAERSEILLGNSGKA